MKLIDKKESKDYKYAKKLDKYAACLWCNPTSFCGSRPDDKYRDVCYECLSSAVDGYSKTKKSKLLLWLWWKTSILNIHRFIRKPFSKDVKFTDL